MSKHLVGHSDRSAAASWRPSWPGALAARTAAAAAAVLGSRRPGLRGNLGDLDGAIRRPRAAAAQHARRGREPGRPPACGRHGRSCRAAANGTSAATPAAGDIKSLHPDKTWVLSSKPNNFIALRHMHQGHEQQIQRMLTRQTTPGQKADCANYITWQASAHPSGTLSDSCT